MKNRWAEPKIMVQKFTPNEYVAACGSTVEGNYLFKCDAAGGPLYYYSTDRWGNKKANYISSSYHPCGKTHETSKDNEFPDGFVDYNWNGKEDEGEGVIVWIERGWLGGISNAHATTNLDRDSWEEQIS